VLTAKARTSKERDIIYSKDDNNREERQLLQRQRQPQPKIEAASAALVTTAETNK